MTKTDNATALTDNQRQALTLLTEGKTPEDAAKVIGVSPRTVYRWRENPTFAAALLASDPHNLQTIFTDVLRVGGKSIALLEKIIDGKDYPTNAKLRAAGIALQHLGGIYELVGLEQRLADIEKRLQVRGA